MYINSNRIFFDTEFTELDARKGELLSIGMIKEDGEELYLELEYDGVVNPWVAEHVVPYLYGPKYTKAQARDVLIDFVGPIDADKKEKPMLIAHVNQFDAVFWYDLFGSAQEHPAFWIPIDFASILYAHGYSPESLRKQSFYTEIGAPLPPKFQDLSERSEHNALEDARHLRATFHAFEQYLQKKHDLSS